MNQYPVPGVNLNSGRNAGRCFRTRNGTLGSVLSNVLHKRKCISRSAPRLLCTLQPGAEPPLKINTECLPDQNEFQQWFETCRAIVSLPTGIPKLWRQRVWVTLANHYLQSISIDWEHFYLHEQRNLTEDVLGMQIDKDLRQSRSDLYGGSDVPQFHNALKRLLLAYAHWNGRICYCQGFIIPAAVILMVMERDEGDALKVLVYLLDKVLPANYFANNLSALTVDVAIFHDLLKIKLPELSQHLDRLCTAARKGSDERCRLPVTSVTTMQWFLTLFTSCFPKETILRVWDAILFEGSEVLLRVALALWTQLGEWIKKCQSLEELSQWLSQEMMETKLMDCSELMQAVYSMATFPFPQVVELREKYRLLPFQAKVAASSCHLKETQCKRKGSNDRDGGCPRAQNPQDCRDTARNEKRKGNCNMTKIVQATVGDNVLQHQSLYSTEQMATHPATLKQQYSKLTKRQQQNQCLTPRHGSNDSSSPGTPLRFKKSKVINRFLGGKKLKNSSKSNRVHHTPSPRVHHTLSPRVHQTPSPRTPQSTQKEQKNKITVPWCSQKRVPRKGLTRNLKVRSGCSDTVGLLEDQNDGGKTENVKVDDPIHIVMEESRKSSQLPREIETNYNEPLAIQLYEKEVDNLAGVGHLFKTLQIGEANDSLMAAESSNKPGVYVCSVELRKDQFRAKNFTAHSDMKTNLMNNIPLVHLSGKSFGTQNLALHGSCSNIQISPFNK